MPVATRRGELELRGKSGWLEADVTVADLADEQADPTEAPHSARSWSARAQDGRGTTE